MKTPSVLIGIIAILILIPQTSGCYRSSVRNSLNETVHTIDNAPKVLADYQPWFGDPQHIRVGYSTLDPAVLRKQIQQAKEMGIYAFAVDWYGNRHPFLDRSYALLQQIASENQFHVLLMYDETEEDNGHGTEDALDAFDKAYKEYIGPQAQYRNAYVTYEGRPVIFIFPKRGRTDWDQVRRMVDGWEKPPLLIYEDNPPEQYAKNFDGIYAWVHPGPKGWTPDGSAWGKEYLENFYERMPEKYPGKMIVGGVWPGFDDTKASWSLNRHIDRRCGKTFDDTLRVFRKYHETTPMPYLLIATWNDYEEGTAIENGISYCNQQQAKNTSVPGKSPNN